MSLIGCCSVLNFRAQVSTNQRHYTDLCRATSSVRNFSGRISTSIPGSLSFSSLVVEDRAWDRDWSNFRRLLRRGVGWIQRAKRDIYFIRLPNTLPCSGCFLQSSTSSSRPLIAGSFSSSDASGFLRSFRLPFLERLVLTGVELTIGLTEDANSEVRNNKNIMMNNVVA